MPQLTLALFQNDSVPLNPSAQLAALDAALGEAARAGAELLITPELFLCGYNIGAKVHEVAEPHDGGSKVRIHNQLSVKKGTWHVPVFRVMLSVFGGAKSGMEAYFRQIAGKQAKFAWE